MKTTLKFFFTFFFLKSLSVSAQITFEKAYGGSASDFGYSVQQTTDSGYILLGETESFTTSRDLYLIKTDQYGDTLWTRTYGGLNFDSGSEVQQTMDGGYILCGRKDFSTYVIKTNNNGDTLWTKTYMVQSGGNSVKQTTDNGYAIAGDIWMGGPNYKMLLIKTDSNGDTLWTRTFGNNQIQGCTDLKQTNDGGYILTGHTGSMSATDFYLVKTNSNGDTLWTKSFGGSSYETAYSVEQTSDNGFIVLGNSDSFGGEKFYLVKTNSAGDTLWTKVYDNGNLNDEGYEVKQTPDGGYAFAAETDRNGFPYEEVYLVKTNGTGDTIWTRTYNQGSGNGLELTSDGGYVIIGITSSFGAGMHDVYLIKTDNNGIVTGIQNTTPENSFFFNIYPIPFNNFTKIEFKNSENNIYSLMIYDSQGRLVREVTNIITGEVTIERKNLKSGLYFFQLQTDRKVATAGKLIIE